MCAPFPLASLQQMRTEEAAREEYAQQIDRLKSAHRKGVTIAFGTDVIAQLPGMNRGVTALQWIDSYVAAGLTSRDIVAAMTAFRSGEREATVMDRIAKGYSDEEIRAIADWYEAQSGPEP